MGDYIPRCVDAVVERYLGIFGAVLIRKAGGTTPAFSEIDASPVD